MLLPTVLLPCVCRLLDCMRSAAVLNAVGMVAAGGLHICCVHVQQLVCRDDLNTSTQKGH